MQILLITRHLNIGGIPRYVVNLAKGLKENGHQVYVASSGGILVSELTQYNIFHITIPINTKSILSPQILKSFLILATHFRKKHIDIVHSHTRVTSVLAKMLAKYFRAHHITTVHGIYKKKISRIVISCLAKKIIAVSQETKIRLQNWQKISPDRIEVIPNAIDINFFANYKLTRNEVRKKLGLGENVFVIGNISRIEKIKGQELIITAFIQLKEKMENLKLIFVGEGKDRLRLQKMVEKNFFKDVFFWGAKEDIRPYLRAIDVFCFTPYEEPFGLVLLEAMAMKIPIIASSVSEIPIITDNGTAALLIPPGDIQKLKTAILTLYNNPNMREQLITRGWKQVTENYSLSRMVKQVLNAYYKMLSNE